ncbi:MAG: ribonuclease H-like domain-containing protein [Clostridiales bacterium]|nr:ribonuclease H-like domain-containing protein [Clostridiales bacterium]
MEILKNTHKQKPYQSKIFNEYFEGLNIAFYDIETTGLNPLFSKFILGGILVFKDDEALIYQYFADNEKEEKELLEKYCSVLAKADVLISYNGNGFDLPFLKQRIKRYNLNIDLGLSQSFDLYRVLNLYSNFREILPDLKQKTVEKFLGLDSSRYDKISGYDSVELYKEYCKNPSIELRNKILLHNHDDLLQLSNIIQILGKLDLHKILHNEGFTVAHGEKRVFIKQISLLKNHISAKAITKNIPLDYHSFEIGYQAVHLRDSNTLTLEVPILSKQDIIYIDLENLTMDYSCLHRFPSCINDYLIIKKDNEIKYAEINSVLRVIINQIMGYF